MNESAEAVIFDLGNTLVSYYRADEFEPILHSCVSAIVAVLRQSGHALDIGDALARARTLNRERDDYRVWPLADRLHELVGHSNEALRSIEGLPPKLLDELTDAFLTPIFASARRDPQAIDVLELLRARGIRTAIVSNTPWGSPADRWRGELARLGLLDCVDAAVFCVDVGWRKPAPQPFVHAVNLLGIAPERTLFVGDDPVWDVTGALGAGIEPVLLSGSAADQPAVTVIRELRALLPLLSGSPRLPGTAN